MVVLEFVLIFAVFCSFFVGIGFKWWFDRAVKVQALSYANSKANAASREAKTKQEGELMGLISEATMAFKAGKDAGEDIKTTAAKVLPGLMAKYPTVIAKHGKKLLKTVTEGGGLEGLEDFL